MACTRRAALASSNTSVYFTPAMTPVTTGANADNDKSPHMSRNFFRASGWSGCSASGGLYLYAAVPSALESTSRPVMLVPSLPVTMVFGGVARVVCMRSKCQNGLGRSWGVGVLLCVDYKGGSVFPTPKSRKEGTERTPVPCIQLLELRVREELLRNRKIVRVDVPAR